MMKFVLAYKSAIDKVTADKSLKLRKYELDNEDWGIIKDLVAVLETYKKATLFFSQDSVSIAVVIPAMDKLDSHLNPHTRSPYHPAIKATMKLACKKINHYYLMTDLSSLYRIAMVLHPDLKLEYFWQQDWEDKWISHSKEIASEVYVKQYEGKSNPMQVLNSGAINDLVSFLLQYIICF
ncbi:hypothetical protein EV702DRAFT_966389 [Suillus placidus]|uniref:Uncharacterized protein n=1 Tax=Suillus placidus TaxID=48579 RepID=A0A9P6ZZA3_9AGAM|nr:hypothetical protein EV702DRAFT_966389 [Suillus placidus]